MSAGDITAPAVHHDHKRPAFGYQRPENGHHSLFDSALRRKHHAQDEQNTIGAHLADMLLDGEQPDKYWLATYAQLRAAAQYAAAVYEVEAAKIRAA